MSETNSSEFYNNKCNLTLNPFRSNAIYETDPRSGIWVGHNNEKNKLERKLRVIRADQVGQSHMVIIYGELGAGKSHSLLWARHLILEKNREEFNAAVYYIQSIKTDKVSIGSAFEQNIVKKSDLKKDLKDFRNFIKTQILRYREDNKRPDDKSEEELLEEILPSSELKNFLKPLLKCESIEEAEKFIYSKFSSKNWTDNEAINFISQVTNSFVFQFPSGQRFKKGVYLLIDEFDTIINSPMKEQTLVNDHFRHLYDNCPESLGVFFGLSGSAAELPMAFQQPILSRVSGEIFLDILDRDQGKEFIRQILESHRLNGEEPNKNDFYPFNEDTINEILGILTTITPRKIMKNFHNIIEQIRLSDKEFEIIDYSLLEDIGVIEDLSDIQ